MKYNNELLQYLHFGLGDVTRIPTNNPLPTPNDPDFEKRLIQVMSAPEYFYFALKTLFDLDVSPIHLSALNVLWHHAFPMLICHRGWGKSFYLALYSIMRGLLNQGSKITFIGAGFRQAKQLFNYAEQLWNKSSILRDIVGDDGRNGPHKEMDRWTLRLADSLISALPLGAGDKIRGERSNYLIVDEFKSVNVQVFEEAVGAFSIVSQDPMERVRTMAKVKYLKENNMIDDKQAKEILYDKNWNQRVISGTAYFSFNHFYQYWQKYKAIIASAKNPKSLEGIFPDGKLPEGLNPNDYAIVRVPVEASPPGFLDDKQVAQLKSTIHSSLFAHEMGACFTVDSDGFYSRRLIESCVVANKDAPIIINDEEVRFDAAIKGNLNKRYIYGVDPASESDNFAIVILEVYQTHRRVIYCWTTRKSYHAKKLQKGLTIEKSFYGFVIEKIVELMKYFPCEAIGVDSGGGGITIREEFRALKPEAILEMIEPDEKKDTDYEHGLHILKMINFSDSMWVARANHGMKRDFEQKYLILPRFNQVLAATTTPEEYENEDKLYDTLEDCMWEIEELKDEVSIIQHSQTPSGREKWDLPDTNETGVLRKDRYTALLIANALADEIQKKRPSVFDPANLNYGGEVHEMSKSRIDDGPEYFAPPWFTNPGGMGDFGIVIRR